MAHIFSCSLEQITRIVQLDPSALNLTDGFILIFYQFALMAVVLSHQGLIFRNSSGLFPALFPFFKYNN
jgi:hypothetical protein